MHGGRRRTGGLVGCDLILAYRADRSARGGAVCRNFVENQLVDGAAEVPPQRNGDFLLSVGGTRKISLLRWAIEARKRLVAAHSPWSDQILLGGRVSTNENEFFNELGGVDEPTSISITPTAEHREQFARIQPAGRNGAHSTAEGPSSNKHVDPLAGDGPVVGQQSASAGRGGGYAGQVDGGPDTGPIAVQQAGADYRAAPATQAPQQQFPGGYGQHHAAPPPMYPQQQLAPQLQPQPHFVEPQPHYPAQQSWSQAAPSPAVDRTPAAATSTAVARPQRSASDLHQARKRPSKRGWRKWLYQLSGSKINVGESRDEIEVRLLETAIKTPLSGPHSVVVTGGKGGCGKTVVTTGVATVFAKIRQKDPVVAADADPAQAANLPDRIAPGAASTFADVLAEGELRRNSDLRNYVGQNLDTGLDVLAGPARVGGHTALDATTYTQAHLRLQSLYNLLFTDTGVDFGHAVMSAVLTGNDSLIMVASAVPDGLAGANIALKWLDASGYKRFEPNMVIVINHIRAFDGRKDRKRTQRQVQEMREEFTKRVSEDRIFELPYDPHIAEAGVLEYELLAPSTRRVLMKIAAATAGSFGAVTGGQR